MMTEIDTAPALIHTPGAPLLNQDFRLCCFTEIYLSQSHVRGASGATAYPLPPRPAGEGYLAPLSHVRERTGEKAASCNACPLPSYEPLQGRVLITQPLANQLGQGVHHEGERQQHEGRKEQYAIVRTTHFRLGHFNAKVAARHHNRV